MTRNYWMIVIRQENFSITRSRGFSLLGVKWEYKRRAERMEPGDRILFYLPGVYRFAATATVAGKPFEDSTPIWVADTEDETFPCRVEIRPDMVVEEEDFLDARQIGPRMEYVKRWIPEQWPLAFQGNLHLIPRRDFTLIEEELRKAGAARARGRSLEPRQAAP